MNICIPVNEDKGLQSPVCEHFGSAPLFLVVDTDTAECRSVDNRDRRHAHGMCQPLSLLAGERLDGIVVGGIGRGALARLRQANVAVYLSTHATVGETVEAFKAGSLQPVSLEMACGGRHGGRGEGRSGCGPGGPGGPGGRAGRGGRRGRGGRV